MGKDALSFLHDSNARNDPKLVRLKMKFGWEGIGIFWALVEIMREQDGFKIKKEDIDVISHQLQPCILVISDLIEACYNGNIGLFNHDENFFWSESLNKRMEAFKSIRKRQSEGGKLAMQRRWHNSNKSLISHSQVQHKPNIIECNITKLKQIYNNDVWVNVAVKVIEYLNKKTGKDFRLIEENVFEIMGRQSDGYKLSDFIKVIDTKTQDEHFKSNPKFLNPKTLFQQPNFDRYRTEEIKPLHKTHPSQSEHNIVVD